MNILLPEPIEKDAISLLESHDCNVIVAPDPSFDTVQLMLEEAHGMIVRTGITVNRDLLALADNLQLISRTGAGLDNIDVTVATEKKIIVTSNLGVNTVSVVEHVLSLLLLLIKKIPIMDQAVREGNFKIRYKNIPRDLNGKTIGLLGFGRIGSEIGRICHQLFNMQVVAFDPFLSKELKEQYDGKVTFVELHELFSNSDILSIHVPLTEATHHLVNASTLNEMKSEAILINTSRGDIIDETALIKMLQENKIGGAGLDVFSKEPVPADHPLLELKNVILTPHSAALTQECVIRMAVKAAKCIIDVFAGRKPPNVANPQVLELERWQHLA